MQGVFEGQNSCRGDPGARGRDGISDHGVESKREHQQSGDNRRCRSVFVRFGVLEVKNNECRRESEN